VIADRAAFERAYAQAVASAAPPALPDYWGGYRVSAETIEFWQGRQNRLQDRLRYTRAGAGWRIERLVP
jgi:pyridoxamine 5'-phosphate oxidase